MQISISLNSASETPDYKKGSLAKLRTHLRHTSAWNCFVILIAFVIVVFLLYSCKAYTGAVLIWLETQDAAVIYLVIVVLFIIVSFPISVGYIIIVIAAGYLFGIGTGLLLSITGANLGLVIAHSVIKLVKHNSSVRSFISSETAAAIVKVISGPACFKIVFCARLTPIPFGLQNSIFALSSVNSKMYHVASLLGLLPGQVVGVCVGSSLRSMQDVLDDQHISTFTYVFATVQLVFAAGLLVWLGSKARMELARALSEADKFGIVDNKAAFNIV